MCHKTGASQVNSPMPKLSLSSKKFQLIPTTDEAGRTPYPHGQ